MKILSHQKVACSNKVGLRTGPAAAQASMNAPKVFVAGKPLKQVGDELYARCMWQLFSKHSYVITCQ